MEEKFLAKKSKKAENIYLIMTLVTGCLHLVVFAISAINLFLPGHNKMFGLSFGLTAGVAVLILFMLSFWLYISTRSLPEDLIKEKEDGFSILNGKEYCQFGYIEDVYAKPFLKMKKENNFGKIVFVFPSGEIYKVKSVENVFEAERRIKEILSEKGAAVRALED